MMDKTLQDVFASLALLQARQAWVDAGDTIGTPSVFLDWRKSITRHSISCLECGAVYKQLSNRHLREHDLNAKSYRAKYDIPQKMPLAARDTTARRRKVVQDIRPWEKTPRYLAMQKKKAAVTKKRQRRSGEGSAHPDGKMDNLDDKLLRP